MRNAALLLRHSLAPLVCRFTHLGRAIRWPRRRPLSRPTTLISVIDFGSWLGLRNAALLLRHSLAPLECRFTHLGRAIRWPRRRPLSRPHHTDQCYRGVLVEPPSPLQTLPPWNTVFIISARGHMGGSRVTAVGMLCQNLGKVPHPSLHSITVYNPPYHPSPP